jgi:hypothetical protein
VIFYKTADNSPLGRRVREDAILAFSEYLANLVQIVVYDSVREALRYNGFIPINADHTNMCRFVTSIKLEDVSIIHAIQQVCRSTLWSGAQS